MEKKKKKFIDHYKVLGLPTGEEGSKLTDRQITKAFRAKALQLHPDKRPNDPNATSEFQMLKSSYEVLIDPKARTRFDAFLVRRSKRPSKPVRVFPQVKRERPNPKRESPEPKSEDKSEPNRGEDDEALNRKLKMYWIGFLIVTFPPMVFPVARSVGSCFLVWLCYSTGFDLVHKGQQSEYWEVCEWAIQLGQFFKRQYYKLRPPHQAADNQGTQEGDHEDIEDWVMV